MYSLGQLELDTIILVEFFEVYTLQKTICLLIGLCRCAKYILTEFIFTSDRGRSLPYSWNISVMDSILGLS